MKKRNILKTTEQMYEDYGMKAIIFPLLTIIMKIFVIFTLMLFSININSQMSGLMIPSTLFVFIFLLFDVWEIFDLSTLHRERLSKSKESVGK
jgi:hypothetical protein